MAPAEASVVLRLEVLRVVEEQVDVLCDRPARNPVARALREVAGGRPWDVRDARAVRLDPVPDPRSGPGGR